MVGLKYLLWLLSTGLAFAGAWFFKFTREHSDEGHRLTLTRSGRIALPVATLSFLLAAGLQVFDDRQKAERQAQAETETRALRQNVTTIEAATSRMLAILQPYATPPDDSQARLAVLQQLRSPELAPLAGNPDFVRLLQRFETSSVRYGGAGEPPCPPGSADDPHCQPGEGAIGFAVNVAASSGPGQSCSSDAAATIAKLETALAGDANTAAETLVDASGRLGIDVQPVVLGTGATCGVLAVRIPATRSLTRIQLTISADGRPGQCSTFYLGRDRLVSSTCSAYADRSVFDGASFLAPEVAGRLVAVVFENSSTTQMMTPYLRAYYR